MLRIASPEEARALLETLGAPQRLVTHGLLVLEAADALLHAMRAVGVRVDDRLVRAGAMLHDAGKTLHPNELAEPGARHEEAGEALLLAHDVDPTVARCCVSHACWSAPERSLEELLVALADALWKGVRRPALETLVIDAVASRRARDRWSLFVELDSGFETIASGATERLARSA